MNQSTVLSHFAGWSFAKCSVGRSIARGVAIASLINTIATAAVFAQSTVAQANPPSEEAGGTDTTNHVDTAQDSAFPDSSVLEQSPVWQRWQNDPPNVLDEIRNTPALPPRVRLGIASNREWLVGVEDITVYDRLVLRGHYRAAFDDQSDEEYGADLGYYLFPRGSYINVSPLLGFRHLDLGDSVNDGVNVGILGTVALAPGAADLAVSYSLLDPFAGDEATLGSVTAAYHLTRRLRLASQVNWRHSVGSNDIAVGVFLEVKLF